MATFTRQPTAEEAKKGKGRRGYRTGERALPSFAAWPVDQMREGGREDAFVPYSKSGGGTKKKEEKKEKESSHHRPTPRKKNGKNIYAPRAITRERREKGGDQRFHQVSLVSLVRRKMKGFYSTLACHQREKKKERRG